MNKLKTISFPHLGDYYYPIKYLLNKVIKANIVVAPKMTSKTIELGCKYSPEFACAPFKYAIGAIIDGLDKGADVIIQMNSRCRYGCYDELQQQILRDLGYDLNLINFIKFDKNNVLDIYKKAKKIDSKFSSLKGIYYLFITTKMIKYIDRIDYIIRANIGFESKKGSFKNLKNDMLKDFVKSNNFTSLYVKYKKYLKKFKTITINKPNDCYKIGIIGEIYNIMEPFANYDLEETLANYGIEAKRFTNIHYLLFEKKNKCNKYVKYAKEHIKYKLGAYYADSVGKTKYLCINKYDGIIHIKSSFCTPEIGTMPIIDKICKQHDVPLLNFSFDENTRKTDINTRTEAFCEMMRR